MATSVPEAVASPTTGRLRSSETLDPEHMSRRRRIGLFVAFGVAVLFVWEAVKWLGGVPWRFENVLGQGVDYFHDPPFRWAFATDLNLPHWWDIGAALVAPV
jgi:hypothetical protein